MPRAHRWCSAVTITSTSGSIPQPPTGAARPNGIREFVVGTGGRSLYPFGSPHANSAARVQAFGYLRLTLGTNAYGWQFVTERGEVRDAGSATCH